MRSLPENIRKLCAADESLLRPGTALDMFCPPRPFGIFNIQLMKCGGIAPGMEIATMAGHAGIELMWGCMDESIVSKARTPKGMRTLQAILDATYVLISTEGVAAASQEAIAKRANLTQSAVRYYFPKKENSLGRVKLEEGSKLTNLDCGLIKFCKETIQKL